MTDEQIVKAVHPKAFVHYHNRFKRFVCRANQDCTLGTGNSISAAWADAAKYIQSFSKIN